MGAFPAHPFRVSIHVPVCGASSWLCRHCSRIVTEDRGDPYRFPARRHLFRRMAQNGVSRPADEAQAPDPGAGAPGPLRHRAQRRHRFRPLTASRLIACPDAERLELFADGRRLGRVRVEGEELPEHARGRNRIFPLQVDISQWQLRKGEVGGVERNRPLQVPRGLRRSREKVITQPQLRMRQRVVGPFSCGQVRRQRLRDRFCDSRAPPRLTRAG